MDYHIILGVLLIGLIHGFEPGHGWPIAVYYSLRKKNRLLNGLVSSAMISFFHLFSSIVVVSLFLFFNEKFDIVSFPISRYLAFILLLFLAIKAWFEKP